MVNNIYPEKFELSKENTDKLEVSFLDLDIKIRDRKFQVGLFDKRVSFPFSIARMPDKSNNAASGIFFAIGAKSLRIARASGSLFLLIS